MKNINFYIVLIIIVSQFIGFFALAKANSIDSLKVDILNDGRASITWISALDSRSTLYFGLSKDELNWQISNLDYKRRHETVLSGLKKDHDYYFKIVLRNDSGQSIESFVNYFNTKNMVYITLPDISNFNRVQVIDEAAYFTFNSNRDVRYDFHYGEAIDALNRKVSNYRYLNEHEILVNRYLKPNTNYYYRLNIYDKDNNLRTLSGKFKTSSSNFSNIQISQLMPSHSEQMPKMPEKAIISWQTNILSTSEIYYGQDPSSLRTKARVSQTPSLNHYIALENLEADTTYYFEIRLKSFLNKATLKSQVYTFKTAALSADYLNQYWQSGDLVNYRSSTYLIFGDKKIPIYNNEKINDLKNYQEIKKIDNKYLEEYESSNPYYGIFFDGQVVKEDRKNLVYLIDGEYKRPIANYLVFSYLNYKDSDIKIVSRSQIRAYRNGDTINHSHEITGSSYGALYNNQLVKSHDSATVYLIVNNQKLAIIDEKTFHRHGFNFSKVITIDKSILQSFELGQTII